MLYLQLLLAGCGITGKSRRTKQHHKYQVFVRRLQELQLVRILDYVQI